MADNIEHQDKVELVTNCDRFNGYSCKHMYYGCICCNETFYGDKRIVLRHIASKRPLLFDSKITFSKKTPEILASFKKKL